MKPIRTLLIAASLALAVGAAPAQDELPTDIVDQFHRALETNNTAGALALLARDVVVFEFGLVDPTLEAYAFAHLPFDMDYKQQTNWEQTSRRMGGAGDIRWVLTTYRVTGDLGEAGRIDEAHLETMILQRISDAWRIVHMHWSSVDSDADTLQGNRPIPGDLDLIGP